MSRQVVCGVKSCYNAGRISNDKLKFHRVGNVQLNAYREILKTPNLSCFHFVCSDHFTPDCFHPVSGKLKKYSLPQPVRERLDRHINDDLNVSENILVADDSLVSVESSAAETSLIILPQPVRELCDTRLDRHINDNLNVSESILVANDSLVSVESSAAETTKFTHEHEYSRKLSDRHINDEFLISENILDGDNLLPDDSLSDAADLSPLYQDGAGVLDGAGSLERSLTGSNDHFYSQVHPKFVTSINGPVVSAHPSPPSAHPSPPLSVHIAAETSPARIGRQRSKNMTPSPVSERKRKLRLDSFGYAKPEITPRRQKLISAYQ